VSPTNTEILIANQSLHEICSGRALTHEGLTAAIRKTFPMEILRQIKALTTLTFYIPLVVHLPVD
jgi:hypothetical protein